MEDDVSVRIKFNDICNLLDKLQKEKGSQRKEELLRKYINSFNIFKKEFQETTNQKDVEKNSFYPVLRLLIPGADNVRGSYGIQVTRMGNLYTKLLNLPPEGEDARKLKFKNDIQGYSDFADVVYSIMKNRCKDVQSPITLKDVNNVLDAAAGSDLNITEIALTKFIETASPMEQKWLIRIILRKMCLNMGEKTILRVLHPRAMEVYQSSSDLLKVCEFIESGCETVKHDLVSLFKHVRPMLCQLLNMQKAEGILGKDKFYVETKMDGERFQIHFNDNTFKYFSRNGFDYTKNFGSLSLLLSTLIDDVAKNFILDGEMMVWDREEACYRVKGENIDVKSLHTEELRPCFVAYDILYLNNTSLLDKTYGQRHLVLKQIIKEQLGVLCFCKRSEVRTLKQLSDCINDAIDDDEEGVVIKGESSIYKPGSRNSGWYKIKPDYINGVISDFDLLIIGGFKGRSNFIRKFMLGVYNKTDEERDESPSFYSFAKVGSGLSYEKRKYLNEMLFPHWNSTRDSKYIEWGSLIPDVWIEPKNSVIVKVRATELVRSSAYRTAYTLRFPRMEELRNDKPWNECCTLQELEIFSKNNAGVAKITKRPVTTDDFGPVAKRTKSHGKLLAKVNVYSPQIFTDCIPKEGSKLDGLTFCILSSSKGKPDVHELKCMVMKHGGKVVEHPLPDTTCVAGATTYRVRKLIEQQSYDIVSVDWLLRNFGSDKSSEQKCDLSPGDMIFTTAKLNDEFKKRFDEYGDSFIDRIDHNDLKLLFDAIKSRVLPTPLQSEILSLEESIYGVGKVYNIFRSLYAQFYSMGEPPSNMMKLSQIIFKARGGQIIDITEEKKLKKVQYIFVDDNFKSEQFDLWFNSRFNKCTSKCKVLSCSWILAADDQNCKCDIGNYTICGKE